MNDYKSIADFADDHDEWVVSPTDGFCKLLQGRDVFLFALPAGENDPWDAFEAAPPGSNVTGSLITGTITKFEVETDETQPIAQMLNVELTVELPDGTTTCWDFCEEWMDLIYLEEAA